MTFFEVYDMIYGKRQKEETEMKIRDMESKDYPEIDRLMKELHELHVKGRPDLYTELEHPYSKEEVEKIVDDPERSWMIRRLLLLSARRKGRLPACV